MNSRCFQTVAVPLAVAFALATGGAAWAGPWSRLPGAVTRLQEDPADRAALAVLEAAERACLAEARSGHLAAVKTLVGAYDELVSPLAGMGSRLERFHRKLAGTLVAYGDSVRALDTAAAGMAWTLAGEIGPDPEALRRLRGLLLPPADPRPGQTWTSPVDGAELVWLPGFRFLMGCTPKDGDCRDDEKYLRWVTVRGIWMERTEVTNARYGRCVEAGGCEPPADDLGFTDPERADEPVAGVTWFQAADYAAWAGRRLPSEAEWERAARGKRTDWRYPWGNYRMRERANVRGTAGPDVFPEVAPVASFPWTGWGLHDMAGNLWEWCEDTYHEVLVAGPRDGSAWVEGGRERVVRGGSWRRGIEMARVSARWKHDPAYRADDLGFRCVADAGDEVGDVALLSMAQAAFPLRFEPGRELEAADLDTADRRYLDRRILTWLVVEGHPWEALPRAVILLGRDPGDPVALGFLDDLERLLERDAVEGDVGTLAAHLERYRTFVSGSPDLGGRLARTTSRIARALKRAGIERQRLGDVGGASECFQLALRLTPGDSELQRLAREAIPEAGTRRTWKGDGREMVWVPSGRFLMGRGRGDDQASSDEQPAHTVRIQGFWMDRTEVTNDQYRRCVEAGACSPPHKTTLYENPDFGNFPVLWVDWFQARSYARWAGKRLPTEAEWEYAARAGRTTRYPWGDTWQESLANGFGTRGSDIWSGPSPVGSFAANRWGLFDMIGNAREWVEDAYHSSYHGAPADGRAWNQVDGDTEEPHRVLRGGSWMDFPPKLRVSARSHRAPDGWSRTTGFRCAASQ